MDTKITSQNVSQAVAIAGSVESLASQCNVSVQAVYKWLRGGKVSLDSCLALESALEQKMSRFDFLPDPFQKRILHENKPAD